MAKNAANGINFYLVIDEIHQTDLAGIRHWNNLKIAFDAGKVWVKDLDYAQVNGVEVKSIPYKTVYYEQGGKLFLQHSHLPDRNIPSLLWTPIERALPIRLPSLNHNYFGLNDQLSIQVVPSEIEMEAVAMITTIRTLEQYMETAPEIRLQNLDWVILNQDRVLLTGNPLLPIDGKTYWKRGNHLLPTGFDFDLFLLSNLLDQQLNPDDDQLLAWNDDSSYFPVEKSDFQPLSLSSFRLSLQSFSQIPHQ